MSCGAGTYALRFDRTNPEALAWARARAGQLVTSTTAEARAAVRAVVAEGFEAGLPPVLQARLIRDIVGLTPRDARAVLRQQARNLAGGMAPDRAAASATRYAGKLHRRRALTIARTETMAASNQGQQALWNQARRAGSLDSSLMKTWLTADPCDICAPLEGEQVPIEGEFSLGDNPPAHPNCRCTMGLTNETRRGRG